ncbi:MAG: ABC transporter substrate-binding protein [Candidatus Omnitrophica bacterium]|nr:ABC transporter substrate-binding protein [Candidatus Omnitrophota bacterium]
MTRFFYYLCLLCFWIPCCPAEPPQRVVSQVPGITEILFSLEQGNKIVGVSTYCRYPPEALQKPKVGGLHDSDLEKMLVLRPDWIALFAGQDKIGDVLERNGCRVFYSSGETISDLLKTIRELGRIFEVPAVADNLVSSISRELQEVREQCAQLPRKRVLYAVGREPGSLKQLYGVGHGSFLEELMNLVGGENCLSPSLGRYPVLSREALILANPEVILDAGASPGEIGAKVMPPEWGSLASVQAVREKNVIPFEDPHISIPGPSIAESAKSRSPHSWGIDPFPAGNVKSL